MVFLKTLRVRCVCFTNDSYHNNIMTMRKTLTINLLFQCVRIHKVYVYYYFLKYIQCQKGGVPRVVVSTAAFHARVRGSVPGLGGLKETKMFLLHPRVKLSIVGSLRYREVA